MNGSRQNALLPKLSHRSYIDSGNRSGTVTYGLRSAEQQPAEPK